MKILYIITQGELGGAQKYVYDLSMSLKDDHQIIVASGPENTELLDKLKTNSEKVKTKTLENLVRNIHPFKDIKALFEIKKLIEKENPDIVHLNSSKAGVLGSIAGKLARPQAKQAGGQAKVKTIFTAHGFAFLEPKNIIAKAVYYVAELAARPFRDKIITISTVDMNSALKYGIAGRKQVELVFNGIDLNKFKSADTRGSRETQKDAELPPSLKSLPTKGEGKGGIDQENLTRPSGTLSSSGEGGFLGRGEAREFLANLIVSRLSPIAPDEVWIGCVANLYKTKGVKYLIEAAEKVIEKYPQSKFIVIGEGPLSKMLNVKCKRLNLQNNFFLVGSVEEAWKYMKAFDMFVLPSLKEGFPYVLLEAGLAGLPIVATRVGGVPDILESADTRGFKQARIHAEIPPSLKSLPTEGEGKGGVDADNKGHGEAGVLVEPKSSKAMADGIMKLIDNPEKAETLGMNARKRVKEFTLEKTLAKTIKIYEELVNS